jgi:topoisomerase IA-like protein
VEKVTLEEAIELLDARAGVSKTRTVRATKSATKAAPKAAPRAAAKSTKAAKPALATRKRTAK